MRHVPSADVIFEERKGMNSMEAASKRDAKGWREHPKHSCQIC